MNIVLENIDIKCAHKFMKWKSDSVLAEQIMSIPQEPNIELTTKWITDNTSDKSQVFKGIYKAHDGELELLGVARLMYIDFDSSTAEFGIYIGETKYQNKGIGGKSIDLALKTGFISLNLNKIYLKVNANNHRAVKLYQNKGFVIEGCLEEHFFNGTRYEDVINMALFKEDYI